MEVSLSPLLLDQSNSKLLEPWTALQKKTKRMWKSSGSMVKKITEIDNPGIFFELLRLSKSRQTPLLKARLMK